MGNLSQKQLKEYEAQSDLIQSKIMDLRDIKIAINRGLDFALASDKELIKLHNDVSVPEWRYPSEDALFEFMLILSEMEYRK